MESGTRTTEEGCKGAITDRLVRPAAIHAVSNIALNRFSNVDGCASKARRSNTFRRLNVVNDIKADVPRNRVTDATLERGIILWPVRSPHRINRHADQIRD